MQNKRCHASGGRAGERHDANLESAPEWAGAAARGVGAEPGRAAPGDAAVAARRDALPGHGHLDEPHAGRELVAATRMLVVYLL